jgi:DNA-binding transcriptional MocR family regulator
VSWKALDWATDSEVGSSTTKFILLLLANKADVHFSCYPSIRTLMAESDAGRSTVMRALKGLEASGFITREAQFHDSGARRSSRYLNHPLAPHYFPRPNPGPPSGFDTGQVSTRDGPVSEGHGTGVPNRDLLNTRSKHQPNPHPTP